MRAILYQRGKSFRRYPGFILHGARPLLLQEFCYYVLFVSDPLVERLSVWNFILQKDNFLKLIKHNNINSNNMEQTHN